MKRQLSLEMVCWDWINLFLWLFYWLKLFRESLESFFSLILKLRIQKRDFQAGENKHRYIFSQNNA